MGLLQRGRHVKGPAARRSRTIAWISFILLKFRPLYVIVLQRINERQKCDLEEQLDHKHIELKSLDHDYKVLCQTLRDTEKELELHQKLNLHYVEHIKLMGESKFPDSVSPSPSEDQELDRVRSKLLELEEENKNLAEELKARTADLEMIISQAEHCKRQLGLPAEATITDIQNKIDEMVQLTGLTTELMQLEREINELRGQRTTIERNIAELKRQQNRVEFETRNVMAKNTRLAGRRRIQPVYMPGARAGQQHQFMVLPSLPVKEAIPPDFTLMGGKPKRPGSNTGLVPPIKAVRANTQLSMSQGSGTMRRTDSIIISKRKGSDDSFRRNDTPTSEISQHSSGEKSSAKLASPISSTQGKIYTFLLHYVSKRDYTFKYRNSLHPSSPTS